MIDVKHIQLIVDDARKCSGMIVSDDLASIQTHQIPLIDAFIGVIGLQTSLPYVIIPAQRANTRSHIQRHLPSRSVRR